jgi:hypothetical protein
VHRGFLYEPNALVLDDRGNARCSEDGKSPGKCGDCGEAGTERGVAGKRSHGFPEITKVMVYWQTGRRAELPH